MVGSVRQRSNHYQTLGIAPAASDEQIAEAFARKMNVFRWHPAGAAAEVWIAYETLRDRIKRADYDRALGLAPKPQREWTMAVTREQWTPFVAPVAPKMVSKPAREPEPRSEPPVDPRLESIAATLRELSKPAAVERSPDPAPEPREHWRPDDGVEPLIERILAVDHAEKARLRAAKVRGPDWRKPLIAVGGLLLCAGLIGAYAGLSVSDHEGSAQAETAAKAPKQATSRQAAAAIPQSAPAPITFEPLAQRPVRAAAAHLKPKHIVSRQQVRQAQPITSEATDTQSGAVPSDPSPSADPLAPESVASANLPIPNKVVARTIDRIGYSCGDVSSSAAVDGSPGAFDVTCSSGQSFRATRVHGRYHFRRAR